MGYNWDRRMNRELKFRAWSIEYEKFLDCDTSQLHYYLKGYANPVHFNLDYKTITVQQYTGILDKDGKEIYEGDILEWGMSFSEDPFPKLRFVEFNDRQLIWKVVEVGDYPVSVDYLYEAISPSTRWCRVVGNIFENPELLKQ